METIHTDTNKQQWSSVTLCWLQSQHAQGTMCWKKKCSLHCMTVMSLIVVKRNRFLSSKPNKTLVSKLTGNWMCMALNGNPWFNPVCEIIA